MAKAKPDPLQNYLDLPPQPLRGFFQPKTVAVIGAKEDARTVGRTLMTNLIGGGFPGKIYPINPKREKVLDLKCYPSIGSVPEQIDLAIIVTPAKTVSGLIKECVAAGVKAAIVISAGFKELGPPGIELERQVLEEASKGGLRIIGPNCLGIMNPIYGLNATFAAGMALKGQIAFISQSGAMCTAVLDWSLKEKIGFSAFVSIGSMADVDWGDLIDYLGNDPHTHSILIYMETIGNAKAFLSAAKEVALNKPIIVIKPGRTSAAAKAAASHTGSLAGSDEVFDSAMHRVGVLRVDTISELFNMALVLAKQPRPKGPNLTIITNAGGPGVLATDATVFNGAQMTNISEESIQFLNQFLPAAWSHGNPVDVLGDATPERYAQAIEVIAKDPHTDGILVILTPQDMTDSLKTAECLLPYKNIGKPILASWMGGNEVEKGMALLNKEGIPTFYYPDSAAQTFAAMWKQSDDLKALYETPSVRDEVSDTSRQQKAGRIIDAALREKRTLLTEMESKQVLAAYGIPIVETIIAENSDDAVKAAERIGYPIVLKLHSETITHKTDVGGVKLNLRNAKAVIDAFNEIRISVTKLAGKEHFQGVTVQKMIKLDGYELILGSSVDVQFGPVLLFGTGGQLVEVFKDRALALPPLNATLAKRLMKNTKIYEALHGVRGRKAIDLALLEQILVRFSQLIVEQPWIQECDINPLLASPEHIIALDARIVLEKQARPLAIRPYPIHYVEHWKLKDSTPVTLRPIRPEDEPLLAAFHKELSEKSIRARYFEFVSLDKRIAHERLIRVCCADYEREITLIATHNEEILGLARLRRAKGTHDADFKMIIADRHQHKGLGTKLLNSILEIAKKEHIHTLYADILEDNHDMLKMCEHLGFSLEKKGKIIHANLKIFLD